MHPKKRIVPRARALISTSVPSRPVPHVPRVLIIGVTRARTVEMESAGTCGTR